MNIITLYCLNIFVAVLAAVTYRNNNLCSLLIIMLIPKAADMILFTPVAQFLKEGNNAAWFFIWHSINDLFMLALLRLRFYLVALYWPKAVYRPMFYEKVIAGIYLVSIIINLLVFGDYYKFWEVHFNIGGSFFYYQFYWLKVTLMWLEAIILTALSIETVRAVKRLKKQGLID